MSGTVSIIEQYYTNILQRPADPTGLSFFTNQVASGTPLAAVETEIATSAEAQTYVDPIVQLYEGILGRAPDAAGLQGWVSLYESGTLTLAQIADDFVSSPEGQSVLGTSLDAAAIDTLYANSLGRVPSETEVSYWLNSGLTLGQVAYEIAESQEADAHLASPSLSYLLNAGAGVPTGAGGVIAINGSAQTYMGTSGNDTFYAANGAALTTGVTINGNGGSDTLVISNFDAAIATPPLYLESSLLLPGFGTITPTLNGVSTVEIANSPSQSGTVDLSLSTGVTTAELTNSPNASNDDNEDGAVAAIGTIVGDGFVFADAGSLTTAEISDSSVSNLFIEDGPGTTLSSLTTATISSSYEAQLYLEGDSASDVTAVTGTITDSDSSYIQFSGESPVTALTITDSPGAFVDVDAETAPALTITVANSPTSKQFGSGTGVYINSVTGDPLADLTLALTASTAATLDSPDIFHIADFDVPDTAGTTGLQTLTINSTGAEQVDDTAAGSADGVADTASITVTGSGSLDLGAAFSALTSFDSTGFTGSLQAPGGSANAALIAQAGSGLPASYAGLSTADAGLTVTGTNLTTITTGSGNSVVDLAGLISSAANPLKAVTVTFGSGDDVLFLGNSVFTGSTFNGGGGTNVIGIGNGAITNSADGNTFSDFSVLEVGPNNGSGSGGTGTYELAAFGATLTTVALTGLGADDALSGAITLDQAPNALSVVETAYPGEDLNSNGEPLQVNLGYVTPTSGTYNHSVSFVLNADYLSSSTVGGVTTYDIGTITAATLAVGQVTGTNNATASFVPGSYTETVNLASNLNEPTTPVPAADYFNYVQDLAIPDATTLVITDPASLDVATVDDTSLTTLTIDGAGNLGVGGFTATPDLTSITIGGSGDADLGGFTAAPKLSSIDASGSSGAVTVDLFGSGATGFTYDGSSGVDTVDTDDTGGDTFYGSGANDTFTVSNTKPDTFIYKAATDANVTDTATNPSGIFLKDLGTTLSIETINGFLSTGTAKTDDSIDLTGFTGNGSANVLIDNGAGPITGTADLTSVSNLFVGSSGELELTGGQTGTVGAATLNDLAGAFVYQNGADNVEVFIAAGLHTASFAAASDLAINLYNAGGLSATNVAHDLKFA